MSLVRQLDRHTPLRPSTAYTATVLLIEGDGVAAQPLRARLADQAGCQTALCASFGDLGRVLADWRPTLAILGYDLPDGSIDEALTALIDRNVPTLLFTDRNEPELRARCANTCVIDLILRDAPGALDACAALVGKVLRNRAIPVLVVDDQASTRAQLIEILSHQNYHAIEAATGLEALDILEDHDDIEMVVTDYHMPDMDGLELTQAIRARRAADRVRVIGISASSDRALSALFLKAGASDFIYRPYIPEEVWYRINNGLETLEQIRRLRYLAERDPLTGLYNRRAFFEFAHGRMEALKESSGEDGGAVAILDIDHFKKVNDTYGHDTGDAVIREVAGVLGAVAQRHRFLTARFGGEEFVLLMPAFDVTAVHQLCEEVRTTVEALDFTSGSTGFKATVSMGVARIQLSEGIDNNLNAADQMLYMAKNGGRNQVFSDATFSRL